MNVLYRAIVAGMRAKFAQTYNRACRLADRKLVAIYDWATMVDATGGKDLDRQLLEDMLQAEWAND